jgi:hypothetical protein
MEVVQRGPIALLLPLVALLAREVGASTEHPATGDLGLRARVALGRD